MTHFLRAGLLSGLALGLGSWRPQFTSPLGSSSQNGPLVSGLLNQYPGQTVSQGCHPDLQLPLDATRFGLPQTWNANSKKQTGRWHGQQTYLALQQVTSNRAIII
ncbi:MAG: hypothetical protein J3R72DRAFT_457917 [Linnemannia gamsii]|nr:MAG: hypothetical protein J3R72DRAFT_457917 [Linnemannia gamsii]